MTDDANAKYLDTFPAWLRSLGDDAERLSVLVKDEKLSQPSRAAILGGLNYLFKSLDLIPDGIDDIGYLDDAFVLRVAAHIAAAERSEGMLAKLAQEGDIVKDFLDEDYGRLETYVRGLRKGAARGRSVDDILSDEQLMSDFLSDVRGFAKTYQPPSFAREEKNLIKLRAFFDAKLPK